jgi:hypothetical protein
MEFSMLPYIWFRDGRRFGFLKKTEKNMTNVINFFLFLAGNKIVCHNIISIISIWKANYFYDTHGYN